MFYVNGITRINFHFIDGILDSNKQIILNSLTDKPVTIFYNKTNLLQFTVDKNIITITNLERNEGDLVEILLFCTSLTERGGACELINNPEKNAKIQEYYDLE